MSFLSSFEKVSIVSLKIAKKIFKLALYLVVIFFIGSILFNFGVKIFIERPIDANDDKKIEFVVNNDDDLDAVAKKLFNKNLIDDENIFKFRSKFYKITITEGTYELSKSMTIKNILDIFDSNKKIISETLYDESDESEFQLAPENE